MENKEWETKRPRVNVKGTKMMISSERARKAEKESFLLQFAKKM